VSGRAAGWRLLVTVPEAALAPALGALDGAVESLSWFEAGGGAWRIEGVCGRRPDRAALEARLALAAAAAGLAPPPLNLEPLPEVDWLAVNRQAFPPVSAGRYFIHGSSYEGEAPPGSLVLRLDAGQAFGSGSHETTRGCLLALDDLARRRRFRRPLDMGCGSGILAMAMARTWRAPVLAVDIDPVAVAVARENARANGLAPLVRVICNDGWTGAVLGRRGPLDLVTANILAGPLCAMAPALAHGLAPGSVAVLSGLLADQERRVRAACRAHGLIPYRRVVLGDWPTLVLRRR